MDRQTRPGCQEQDQVPTAIAIIVADLERTPLGLPSQQARVVAGLPVIAHTAARMTQVDGIASVVIVHPPGQDVASLVAQVSGRVPVKTAEAAAADPFGDMRASARKWALSAWRGGLGGATCFDELLPASRLLHAMELAGADAAVIVGADWMLADPALCSRILALHLENPEAMQLTFSQAPPGIAGVAAGRPFIQQLAEVAGATFGRLLAYNPGRPQADPIGRDVCVQIPADVRNCTARLIHDLPASDTLMRHILAVAPGGDAQAVCAAAMTLPCLHEHLPRQVTIELTTRRRVGGPIVPQHHVAFERTDMAMADLEAILAQFESDTLHLVTFGGLGDAMLHPQWEQAVRLAHEAGAMGVCLETDLLCEPEEAKRILDLPLDVVSVRVNADTAATYDLVMEPRVPGAFRRVVDNLSMLLSERARRAQPEVSAPTSRPGVPWIVPRLIKTAQTLKDMETFFDRWTHFTGHAVIEPATTGCGRMPAMSPVAMSPPRRMPCRQLGRRLTVLSDRRAALCDQDWCGEGAVADLARQPLAQAWAAAAALQEMHRARRWDELELCAGCQEWHRP
jgi:hypothetical protein